MNKVMLDTNAYTRLLTGDTAVLDALAAAGTVYMSVFVLGELYAGFRGGSKRQRNLALLEDFLQQPAVTVLDANRETAEIFGWLKASMKKAGTPLPINDVWIASHAMEAGAVLMTYDAHFKNIPGLRIWDSRS
jgi:tRNA(fMet)-specific endonuclease VapC